MSLTFSVRANTHVNYNYTEETTLYTSGCITALEGWLQGNYVRSAGFLLISICTIQVDRHSVLIAICNIVSLTVQRA